MKWEQGRQNGGYEKLKIFQFLNVDCYILRYKEGSFIPWHTDPVPGYRHFRLNMTLKSAENGGEFIPANWNATGKYNKLKTCLFSENRKMVFFRSDIVPHMVTPINKGTRIVLTFGIAL